PQDGATDGEDAAEAILAHHREPVLGKPEVAVAESYELPAVLADRGLADGADGGVETRTVAPGGEYTNAFYLLLCHGKGTPAGWPARLPPPGRSSRFPRMGFMSSRRASSAGSSITQGGADAAHCLAITQRILAPGGRDGGPAARQESVGATPRPLHCLGSRTPG